MSILVQLVRHSGSGAIVGVFVLAVAFAVTPYDSRVTAQVADDQPAQAADQEPVDDDEVDALTPEAEETVADLWKRLEPESEAGLMLSAILDGSQLGPNDGWFQVAKTQSKYDWQWALSRFDADDDERISPQEFGDNIHDFRMLDRNGDRFITASDLEWASESAGTEFRSLVGGLDRDGNGKLDASELAGMAGALSATDGDAISIEELRQLLSPPASPIPFESADGPTRSTLVMGLANQEIGSLQAGPALGESAPDFTLSTLEGEEVTLSHLTSEKPVVLVFGNFTCGPFRMQAGNLERIHRRFHERVEFVLVYVREAHPSDGWWMEMNDRVGINIKQPETFEERKTVASYCQLHLDFPITMLVDELEDEVGAAYSGMPSRLYLIDQQQQVVFKSGRGPYGFIPAELETALLLHLNEDE